MTTPAPTTDDLEPRFAGTYHVTTDDDLGGFVQFLAVGGALVDTWKDEP